MTASEYCPHGFSNEESKNGKTVSKRWRIEVKQVISIDECGKECEQNQFCESFEFNFLNNACNLNTVRDVDEDLKKDSRFCIKWICPIGYRPRAGEGFGNLGKTEIGLSLQDCAAKCNKTTSCKLIEFFDGIFCKDKASTDTTNECQKDVNTKCTMKRNIGSTTKPVMEYRLCEKMDAQATMKMASRGLRLSPNRICGGVCQTKGTTQNECKFPFTYQSIEYTKCITFDDS